MPNTKARQRLKGFSRHFGDFPPLKRAFIVLFALWWMLLLFFFLFPRIDLSTTAHFYTYLPCAPGTPADVICGGFMHANNRSFGIFRELIFFLPVVLAIFMIYQLIMIWSRRGASYDRLKAHQLMAGLVALIAGPLLLVNWVLKEFSNRPRPRNTDLFGGELSFERAGDFSGGCLSNCSFVSGEAAGAGWLLCYGIFLMPKRLRLLLLPPLIAISIASPVMRVAYGGHYLSDAVLGWLGSVVIFIGTLYFFTKKDTIGMKE